MKVLQLIPRLASGGAERFVADLANELSIDHEVFIYTLKEQTDENIYVETLHDSVRVGYLDMKRWLDITVLSRLIRCINNTKPDVIHVHGRAFHYLAPIKLLYRNLRIIQTVHSNGSRELLRPLEVTMFRFFYTTKKITPVLISKEQKVNFLKLYPKAAPFIEIPNGRSLPEKSIEFDRAKAEIDKFKKNKDTKIFVNIARLMPQKNHRLLINAFKKFKESGANAVLVIIGRAVTVNEECRKIMSFVKGELNESIHWIGEKKNATDYLHLAHYFCLSSNWEGMPISLIEAFACGCVPISTKVGEIPQMVKDNTDGFLSVDMTENAYANALTRAYNKQGNDLSIIQKNIQSKYLQYYSMKSCAEKYVQVYRTVTK